MKTKRIFILVLVLILMASCTKGTEEKFFVDGSNSMRSNEPGASAENILDDITFVEYRFEYDTRVHYVSLPKGIDVRQGNEIYQKSPIIPSDIIDYEENLNVAGVNHGTKLGSFGYFGVEPCVWDGDVITYGTEGWETICEVVNYVTFDYGRGYMYEGYLISAVWLEGPGSEILKGINISLLNKDEQTLLSIGTLYIKSNCERMQAYVEFITKSIRLETN